MGYDRLLSPNRLRATTVAGRNLETEILSDTGRIISSSAFRRLQTKAQVFSLERNAAVRTRLTHSLEVATFGQFIAESTFDRLLRRGAIAPGLHLPFVQTVQNACLLHDIGNPPFGHLGEFAIRDWFVKNTEELSGFWSNAGMTKDSIGQHLLSFRHFDGNPQGFRILSRLQWLDDEWGLNLTCTLLASTVKYLHCQPIEARPFSKKIGFFPTERRRAAAVWKALGLNVTPDGDPAQRHPLVFLMEAADDIAYCLSDIEDAIEKKVCNQDDVLAVLRDTPLGNERVLEPRADHQTTGHRRHAANARFINASRTLTRDLTDRAAQAYDRNETAILDGAFEISLLDDDEGAKRTLEALKSFARRRIFVAREAVEIELGGFRIIQAILDAYKSLLRLSHADFDRLVIGTAEGGVMPGDLALESRLFTLLPNKHLLAYEAARELEPALEPALRTHLVVDYLAGMTDSYALKIFHMLSGTGHTSLDG
jgi:dGTPase